MGVIKIMKNNKYHYYKSYQACNKDITLNNYNSYNSHKLWIIITRKKQEKKY